MILKTSSGKTHVISSDSTEFMFVKRFALEELASASLFMTELTDEELEWFCLSDLTGDHEFTNGHLVSMDIRPEANGRYAATYYIAKVIIETGGRS